MYKHILFDLDDTLLDFKKSEYESVKLVLKEYNLDTHENVLLFQKINEDCFNKFASGGYESRIEFQEDRFKILFDNLNVCGNPTLSNIEFRKNLSEIVFLMPNALETIKYLSSKYKLYIVSNGMHEVAISRLKIAGIYEYFTDIFISSMIGYHKPDIRFIEGLNEIIKANKSEMIIIGDRYNTDILIGKLYGIDQIYLGSDKVDATYNIMDLSELFDIL